MQTSMFFNHANQDRLYNANDFATYFHCFASTGVFHTPNDPLQVTHSSGMGISVAPGVAFLHGYQYINTEAKALTLDTPDANPRYDYVVLHRDMHRKITAKVRKGQAAATPVPPTLLTEYELPLALVYVATNPLTNDNITDQREYVVSDIFLPPVFSLPDQANAMRTAAYLQYQSDTPLSNTGSIYGFDRLGSAIQLIPAYTSSSTALPMGIKQIDCDTQIGQFNSGDEITIFDDTNFERKVIQSMTTIPPRITVSALTKNFKKHATIARSTGDLIDGEYHKSGWRYVVDKLSESWAFDVHNLGEEKDISDVALGMAWNEYSNANRTVQLKNGWLLHIAKMKKVTNYPGNIAPIDTDVEWVVFKSEDEGDTWTTLTKFVSPRGSFNDKNWVTSPMIVAYGNRCTVSFSARELIGEPMQDWNALWYDVFYTFDATTVPSSDRYPHASFLNPGAGYKRTRYMTVGKQGRVYATSGTGTDGDIVGKVILYYSDTAGQNMDSVLIPNIYEAPHMLTGPAPVVEHNGKAVVTMFGTRSDHKDVIRAIFDPATISFSQSVIYTYATNVWDYTMPASIAIDQSGILHMVGIAKDYNQDIYHIFYMKSTDGGVTWSSMHWVVANHGFVRFPTISINRLGDLCVLWQQRDTVTLTYYVWGARCINGSWSANTKLTGLTASGYPAGDNERHMHQFPVKYSNFVAFPPMMLIVFLLDDEAIQQPPKGFCLVGHFYTSYGTPVPKEDVRLRISNVWSNLESIHLWLKVQGFDVNDIEGAYAVDRPESFSPMNHASAFEEIQLNQAVPYMGDDICIRLTLHGEGYIQRILGAIK